MWLFYCSWSLFFWNFYCVFVALQRRLPRFHTSHASKHVPAWIKGNVGPAVPGKRLQGDVPSSMPHNHRKPAAALYSRPTGHANIVHKPYSGGDGPVQHVKKPAVHIGIPHAKVPDKMITVRCSWKNNLTERTVTTGYQPPRPLAVYRAPTPPPCSADVEYPSCKEDVRLKLERMHMCAAPEASVFPFYFCWLYYVITEDRNLIDEYMIRVVKTAPFF